MQNSYPHSARRHRTDAKHLASDTRFQNAGHLAGFAAECLVKATLEQGGVMIDSQSGLRVHFPDLRVKIFNKGHGRLMRPLLSTLNKPDFLAGWRVELRYEEDVLSAIAEARWQGWIADVESLFVAVGIP